MEKEDDLVTELQEKLRELEIIFQSSHDEIFVTDAAGTCIRVNPVCERHYGLEGIQLIGRNVYDMEREGIFYPSATAIVLKEKRPVTLLQSTGTGRRLLVSANPVFDQNGQLIRVVSNSLDITQVLFLKLQVEEMEKTIEEYNRQLEYLRRAIDHEGKFVAKSQSMVAVFKVLERVSQVDTSVLLLGESGVGKSEVARWLHQNSNRQNEAFVEVNCGAIPPTLFESELFGYEPGAFSGALSTGKAGLLETANRGTLFLDEIAELPLDMQTKLLQVLQNKSFMRVGGREQRKIDVRIVAATNKNLEELVEKGKFRKDLYYRINVVPVYIPPLRERPEDLIEMIFIFLDRINKKYNFHKMLSPAAIDQLLAYQWPGNVRELENTLERLVITAEGNTIHSANVMDVLRIGPVSSSAKTTDSSDSFVQSLLQNPTLGLDEMVEVLEREILTRLMQRLGTTRKVAERLGVNQSTVSRKCRKYNIL